MSKKTPKEELRAELEWLAKRYSPDIVAREAAGLRRKARPHRGAGRPDRSFLYALPFWAAVEAKRNAGHKTLTATKKVEKELKKYWAFGKVPWETIRRLHRQFENRRKRDPGCNRLASHVLAWIKTPPSGLDLMRIRREDGSIIPIAQRNSSGVIIPKNKYGQ
jgi:hypothetical protein